MTTWRHAREFKGQPGSWCADFALFGCMCNEPTPDPASPCGHVFPDDIGCGYPEGDVLHRPEPPILWHPHLPTRCLSCGHPIEATR